MTSTGARAGLARTASIATAVLSAVGQLGIAFMVAVVIADVAMRSLFNAPILGALEVVTYWCMVTVSFIGMWIAQRRGEHISVTMLTDKMHPQAQFLHQLFGNILTLVFLLAVGWYGWGNALQNMARGEFTGATNVLIWPMRFLVPIAMVAFAIVLVSQTIALFTKPATGEDEDEELEIGAQL